MSKEAMREHSGIAKLYRPDDAGVRVLRGIPIREVGIRVTELLKSRRFGGNFPDDSLHDELIIVQMDLLSRSFVTGDLGELEAWYDRYLETAREDSAVICAIIEVLCDIFRKEWGDGTGNGDIFVNLIFDAFTCCLANTTFSGEERAVSTTDHYTTEFETALLGGLYDKANSVVIHLMQLGMSIVEIEVGLIQPSLHNIGLLWKNGNIGVAEEHLASDIVRQIMAEAFSRTILPPLNGRNALLACVAGNRHALGLSMVADAMRLNGWEVHNLGADTPEVSIVNYVRMHRFGMVGLSISDPHQLDAARSVITGLRALRLQHTPLIMVGGTVINAYPVLSKLLDADSSAMNALGLSQNLVCHGTP